MEITLEAARKLALAAEGNPAAMEMIALELESLGAKAEARDTAVRAAALAPDNRELACLAKELTAAAVPGWHFGMMQEQLRNEAYEKALSRVVVPGCRVLEIGTGGGLLAMLAARAGAGEVVTCEVDPVVAKRAEDVIAHNGFSGRIRVLQKHSSKVTLDDLGGPADVLVSEIIGSNLIGEGVLPSIKDAVARLIKPDAAIIPVSGEVRVGLIEDAAFHRHNVGTVCGFDLSPFNELRSSYRVTDRQKLSPRSAPASLFDIDLRGNAPDTATASVDLVASGGTVTGVAQWIRLATDGSTFFENAPGEGPFSVWYVKVHALAAPQILPAGTPFRVHGRYLRRKLLIWYDLPSLNGSGA